MPGIDFNKLKNEARKDDAETRKAKLAESSDEDAAEGYTVVPEVAPPEKKRKEWVGRETYKGFKMPRGLSPERQADWKAAIDARMTEEAEKAVGSPIASFGREKATNAPLFQDLKTGEDFARLGLEVGSMSPIGLAAQTAADVGVMGMDVAAGDYPGAAVSGAAILLPVSAGFLKGSIKKLEETATRAAALNRSELLDVSKRWRKGEISSAQATSDATQIIDESNVPGVVPRIASPEPPTKPVQPEAPTRSAAERRQARADIGELSPIQRDIAGRADRLAAGELTASREFPAGEGVTPGRDPRVDQAEVEVTRFGDADVEDVKVGMRRTEGTRLSDAEWLAASPHEAIYFGGAWRIGRRGSRDLEPEVYRSRVEAEGAILGARDRPLHPSVIEELEAQERQVDAWNAFRDAEIAAGRPPPIHPYTGKPDLPHPGWAPTRAPSGVAKPKGSARKSWEKPSTSASAGLRKELPKAKAAGQKSGDPLQEELDWRDEQKRWLEQRDLARKSRK